MSLPSWQNSLRTKLAKHPRPKVAILGIGNELRGDDAAGVIIARELQSAVGATLVGRPVGQAQVGQAQGLPLHVIDAGAAPEAFTGQLRRFRPDLVLMIDAAQMNEAPGTIRLIEWQDAIGLSATTHTLPLNVIAQYLVTELSCDVAIIGIQSYANAFDTPLSPPVRRAVDELSHTLTSLFTPPSA
ncbi:MAG: hydrogenase maturation peptidase HycI [Chloroflexi bacterium]|nr:hydrogenase maturation peptidase HycI [Chloroflexota bacterium]